MLLPTQSKTAMALETALDATIDAYHWIVDAVGLPIVLSVAGASVVFPVLYHVARSFGHGVS